MRTSEPVLNTGEPHCVNLAALVEAPEIDPIAQEWYDALLEACAEDDTVGVDCRAVIEDHPAARDLG